MTDSYTKLQQKCDEQAQVIEALRGQVRELEGECLEHILTIANTMTNEWQDISTAPDDGRGVLLHRERTMTKALHVILPFTCIGYNCCGHYGEEQFRDTKSNFIQPTHWMPLPQPPEGGK